mmetsp:Transcript_1819/g.2566  ORF Transcript_1819/g.2566 Transcript_1819/m.2566 type:complete len:176 (-) Transcript_1819:76-603(-)|eukprot:CAMPEP_0196595268 /NCGR_PEP_ID=MMETSP1081-20130531/80676_1 /TAXON_ID=36882 /ORGANISM="Pyramimonas amylifera, Strain CCMP720" /LENGTH=175 /DNA_ID=CAMNT_0041919785 /DNA_START=117 /DNA_END=644 /DNA_ORIENTATION=+
MYKTESRYPECDTSKHPRKPIGFLSGLLSGEGHYIKDTLPYTSVYPKVNEKYPAPITDASLNCLNKSKEGQCLTHFVSNRHDNIGNHETVRKDLVKKLSDRKRNPTHGELFDKVCNNGVITESGMVLDFGKAVQEIQYRQGKRAIDTRKGGHEKYSSFFTLDHELEHKCNRTTLL